MIQINPKTKIPAIEFMQKSGDIDIPQHNKVSKFLFFVFFKLTFKKKIHSQIFDKWRDLNGILIEDNSWTVRFAVFRAIELYSKFSIFDFKAIVPKKHLSSVLDFLKRNFDPVSAELEYSHLKNQQMLLTQVIVGRKRGLPLSQENPTKVRKLNPEDQIEEGLKLIRQGLMNINPTQLKEHKSKLEEAFQNIQNI